MVKWRNMNGFVNGRMLVYVYKLVLAMVFSVFLVCLFLFETKTVQALTKTVTSRVDFKAGKFDGTEADSQEGKLKLNPAGSWVPKTYKTPDRALSVGTAIVSDGDYVYTLTGYENIFSRYLPLENKWESLAAAPRMAYYGADLTVLGNYIYAVFGGYQKEFARYSIINNSWEELTNAPDLIYGGGSLSSDGTYVYALRGGATSDFWKYDVSENSWSVLANPPSTIYHGATLVYNNGYLYTPRGYNRNTFYRYDISGNSWTTMTNAPGTFYDVHNADVVNGYIYILRDRSTTDFYRYNISGNSWETLSTAPATTRYVGVVYNSSNSQLYVFRGNGQYDFWKYDIANDEFLGPANLPANPGSGADLIEHNGYLYYPRGYNSTSFYRYDVSGDSWESRANLPASFNDDTKGVGVGGTLFFFRGGNTTSFYSYDTTANSWSTKAEAPATIRYGGCLVYPGSGDYIYATRGNYSRAFYRYSISGDSWDDGAVADLPDNSEAAYGARLAWDGTDIYYFSGSRTNQLLKYNISGDSWTELGSLPYAPFWGTDVVYYNGKFYVQAGYYKDDLWEYKISSGVWRWLGNMQDRYAYGLGPYNGGSLEYVNYGGNHYLYSIYGNNINNMFVYSISNDDYVARGDWTSDVLDLTYVDSGSSWTIASSSAVGGGSWLQMLTRSSADQINWTSWEDATGGTIASNQNRYLQIKTKMSSVGSSGVSISDITANYTGDEVKPSNPTSFSGLSQQVSGVGLTSGGTYGYTRPYFSWSGASDGQSGIAGYYVYFGTEATADPQVVGSYQTGTNYLVVDNLSSDTYYLRLKTKDVAGNVSDAITGFSYVYQGLASQSLTIENDGEFLGVGSSVATTGGKIKLSSKAGFWLNERLSLAPSNIRYGANFAYVSSSKKLYTFRGANTTAFYEYDIETDTWTTKANAPASVYRGGDIVAGPSGYLYAFRGSNTTTFWRYDIAQDSWSDGDATDAPQTVYYGSSLIYDGSQYIYALRGGNDDAFLRYDVLGDNWESLTATDFGAPSKQVNNLVYVGGDLTWDRSDTIYAIQGNTRSGFSSYSISTNEWTTMPNLPALAYSGAHIEYDSTSNAIYYIPGWGKPYLFKFSLNTNSWSQLADVPSGYLNDGATLTNADGNLYVLRGGNNRYFYKYNISKASWLIPTRGLFGGLYRGGDYRSFYYGADMVKGSGDYYYMVRGNYDNLFVRYDASTGESVGLNSVPTGFYVGGALVYDSTNNKIYATGSQYNRRLYVYDVASDEWAEESQDPPPHNSGYGTSMTYDGSRYIYWHRGDNSRNFYRYDTQATAGNRWSSALANLPANSGYGAQLVYKNGHIYTMRGQNVSPNPLYRYDVAADSWSSLSSMPDRVYNDGFLVDGGSDYLYACRGGNTNSCYRYSITADSWSAIADSPAQIYVGGSAQSNGTDKIYVIAGPGTNTYNDGLYTYVMQTNDSAFEEAGSYVSQPHDLTAVYKFAELEVGCSLPSNTTLTSYTRSSSDGSNWNGWSESSAEKIVGTARKYKINSIANRYIQVKFVLTSADGVYSGRIDSYKIHYYQDLTEPTNYSSLIAYEVEGSGTTLTSGDWGNKPSLYFDWPEAEASGGSSDTTTGSGVAGYYVYFGTEATADPANVGTTMTNSYYAPTNLVSGNIYYLRIKTYDEAGNVSSGVGTTFVYKFDNEDPTNPQTVTVDPSGYTASNSFNFNWSGATDSASSIEEYCYKTGQVGSTETCTSDVGVSGVSAYDTGTNTFYVRAKDYGGNMPDQYSTASYYYNSTAPSPPQDLAVSPTSNSVNEFSFSWNPPQSYYGQQSGLRYYYSINNLPTANNVNTVGMSVTYLSSDSYATQKGKNYFYVVAKDEAGNIDYGLYSMVEFSADTEAPGKPTGVEIGDISVKSTESWRLALSWDAPTATGSGIANYRVYRSVTTGADCAVDMGDFSLISTTTEASYVDVNLSQQDYYYCAKACTSTGDCSVPSDTVTSYPDGRWLTAPSLVASPSASVKTKSAIVTWSTSRTCSSFVKYGTSAGNYGEEVGSSTHVSSHEVELEGLDPGTVYYYKVLWTDEDGNTGESDERILTTNPAPKVSTVKVTDVGLYTVYI
ncbi:hypothetical protein DRH14_00290, partial [Candidatus Shapirobacteria bacterium]